MGIHEFDEIVKPLVGLKVVNESLAGGVVFSGMFKGTHDYNRGYLFITINTAPSHSYFVISSIDDGGWLATINDVENFDLNKFVNDFNNEVGVKLPLEEELNNFLIMRNMYGTFNG